MVFERTFLPIVYEIKAYKIKRQKPRSAARMSENTIFFIRSFKRISGAEEKQ